MTKKLSPAIKAVNKVLRFAKNDKLRAANNTGCVYHNEKTGRFCAIGCLLPKKTLDLVKKKGYNEACGASELYGYMPELQKITGLTADQAAVVQEAHDGWAKGEYRKEKFIKYLQKAVDQKELMNVSFK